MPTSLPDIIKYFHDCYRSDNRELVIYDFLDRKIEDKVYFEEKEELLTGEYPIVPIDSEKAEVILKKLEVFQKEKELLYGSFFVCGSYTDIKGDTKKLCSPLFYYPAEIEVRDEFHYLSVKIDEIRINHPLISMLTKDFDGDVTHDKLFQQLPKGFIRFENIGPIVNFCKKYLPNVDFENAYSYPENIALSTVKKTLSKVSKSDSSKAVLLPTGILGIVSKSTNTRGVLNELNELSSRANYSLPLQYLFSSQVPIIEKEYQKGQLPMILSEAQQAILKSSSINPITLIVGPPGTGKSYTIGAVAIEHMSRGESVLIASRTDEAVDVVVEKIIAQIGINKCVVRGGKRRSYSVPLNRYLKTLLTRSRPLDYLIKEFDLPNWVDVSRLLETIYQLTDSIKDRNELITELEASFIREVDNEMDWGDHLKNSKDGFWGKIKTQYLDLRNKFQTPIWEYSSDLHKEDNDQILEIRQLIQFRYVAQVLDALKNSWNDIKFFHEALKISSDTDRLNKFEQIDFKKILKAFPIWSVNSTEVKDVLPYQKEMFDVVIIDEATQCDIASCIPLIQRAKRVVFAGDPSQLRHVSFLSKGIQNLLRNKYNLLEIDESKLNYRDKSVLDLVMNALRSGDQVSMLDEHFRSISPIIAFSNKYFYDDGLRVMTTRPDENEQGLYFIACDGVRNKKGANEEEATQLLRDVKALVNSEQELTEEYCTSLGILSPFRGQVDLLAKMLIDEFSVSEIEKHKIRVGTAYSFQGEERDVMYLSFAVDADSHHSAFHHINKNDVFNVSITRARNRQYVYISLTEKDLKDGSLLRSYLSKPENKIHADYNKTAYYDQFLEQVTSSLKEWGIEFYWPGFSIAGLKVDLLIKHNEEYLGVDLVGYPGEFENTFGIERYRILNRAGIKVFPLPYSDWYFEHETTLSVFKKFVNHTDGFK